MSNITPGRFTRNDLLRLREEVRKVVYSRAGTISVAEVIGVLEIIKLEILSEHAPEESEGE